MQLNRVWIMAHIPHQGPMCLLDEVTRWDGESITCGSASHRDAGNPLRAQGRLGILCGVEYAAQAMAVHGALAAGALNDDAVGPAGAIRAPGALDTQRLARTADAVVSPPDSAPAAGFLAALRGVTAHVSRLDDVPGALIITAARVAGDPTSALYEFEVRSAVACLLSGRATVVLDAKGRLQP